MNAETINRAQEYLTPTTESLVGLTENVVETQKLRKSLETDQPDLWHSVDRTLNSLIDRVSLENPDTGDIYHNALDGMRRGFQTALYARVDRLLNEYSRPGADQAEFLSRVAAARQETLNLLFEISQVDDKPNISLDDMKRIGVVNGFVKFMQPFLAGAHEKSDEGDVKQRTIDYFVQAAKNTVLAEEVYKKIPPQADDDLRKTPTDQLQSDFFVAVRFLAGAEQNYQNEVIFDPRLTPTDFAEIKKQVWEQLDSAERRIFSQAFDGAEESRESAAYLLEVEENSDKPRAIAIQQEYVEGVQAAIDEAKADTSGTFLGEHGDVWGVAFYIYQYIATAGLAIGLLTNPSGCLTDPVTLGYLAVGAGFAHHYGLFDGKPEAAGVRSREDLEAMLASTERQKEYQKYKPILSAIQETQFQPDSALAGLILQKTLAGEITTADLTVDLLQHDVKPDSLPKIVQGTAEARWLFSFLADCVEQQVKPKELIAQIEN